MTWDFDQQRRLAMEQWVLRSEFPDFVFYEPAGRTFVSGTWNSYNPYSVRVELPRGFPDECPSTYITFPSPLYGYARRQKMESYGSSHAMHTWKTDHPGWVKICTYHPSHWSADQTIAKVITKATLWILAYECHLDDGTEIARFLKESN
jgi:hypothetical protein